MYNNYLFYLDFLTEDIFLQILLIAISFFLITTHSLFRKLWGFASLIIVLGLIIASFGYELFVSFLWLIELSFIVVFILLITTFNSSLKLSSTNILDLNLKYYFIFYFLFFSIILVCPVYLYLSDYTNKIKAETDLNLISFSYFINYYKENQANSISLSDLKGLSFTLFNLNFFSLFLFLILLTIASVLIVFIQLQASIKRNINNKLIQSKLIKNRLKYSLNKGFMNKETLEYQLKMRNGLRVLSYKKK